ncbi:glutamine-hydrolyzing GMP synthase [Pyrofollis japonicus]|uniref:glutamine-hydrolyzing GMP synthase n=1 Tax=Pyrofollis japonicus TaxID=3060460 RepID=UPI00295A63F4|nr:glutamine-hydrolyzing GMP synthase [Pyrofollis japonicus]BEP16936.1 glutamine-hydrolyzing GMP synthase [Pyrofollis japonicus]
MRIGEGYSAVAIINFGGQYAHLISRRLRELGVYTEIIHYYEASPEKIRKLGAGAVVLSGGPRSVLEPNAPRIGSWILELGVPVLGICYGHQLLALLIGGRVERGPGEYGRTWVRVLRPSDPLFRGWGSEEETWMSHGDYVAFVPDNAEVLAVSRDTGYIAAFRLRDRPIYGVQFHPEVAHTPKGRLLLDNFVSLVAKLQKNWKPENIVDELVREIRAKVPPGEKVLVAVSGGIDSTTTALLVKRAIGDRLVAVFVNHGLLREGEAEEVLSLLRSLGIEPVYIDASKVFLKRLRGIKDCEEKRKIIGKTFIEIFEDVARSDPSIKWLAQGTTYPDVIESGAVPGADRIKSHHNVGGLPERLGLKVLEPLRYFYKDEVRRIAISLGVPREYAYRHPFPGPGLAVRIIGEVTDEKLRIARRASRIVEEVLRKAGLYDRVWQAFAVVGDDKWVGVKGDSRVDGYIVTIRIVESEDGMTADWSRIPYEVLAEISWRISSEIPEVTMVTYAVTSKPPSTIEPC